VVTTFVLARRAASVRPWVRRSAAVLERNMVVQRRNWIPFASGFFEPVFYLVAVGLGAGMLIGDIRLADGSVLPYARFVAPAMLASAAMNGAVNEAAFGMTVRLKFARVYESVLATPVGIGEVVAGELAWAGVAGFLHSMAFLGLMALLGLVPSWWALVALPVVLLVGLTFSGLGLAFATYARGWQDFEYVSIAMFAQFAFSGAFAPVDAYPDWVRTLTAATPFYHSVELIRDTMSGRLDGSSALHAVFLMLLGLAGFVLGGRRLDRQMLR
jgi:lipooligosaccharide transport system permease protein